MSLKTFWLSSHVALLVALSLAGVSYASEEPPCPVREDWKEGSGECLCQEGWKPTVGQLTQILDAHAVWSERGGWRDPTIAGRAVLCAVNLRHADLEGANLRRANLEKADLLGVNLKRADLRNAHLGGADLSYAHLEEADLEDAHLEGASFGWANLKEASLVGAHFVRPYFVGAHLEEAYLPHTHLEEANLAGAHLEGAKLFKAHLEKAYLSSAHLEGADMRLAYIGKASLLGANLKESHLYGARLDGAELVKARLEGAKLVNARLAKADLSEANLKGANLSGAHLDGAKLIKTHLEGADLTEARLDGADFTQSNVENARLAFTSVHEVVYAPASPPPDGYLEGLEGLHTVTFPRGRQSGLVQLRTLLQNAGLRDLEREATYAIERNKARYARGSASLVESLRGWLRLIFFEWTTGYGLFPSRAIFALLALMAALSVVYIAPIAASPVRASAAHGIFRVWPAQRIETSVEGAGVASSIRAERLTADLPAVFGWALYFSMLSAFHIGWREFNVGTWVVRIQPREFTLRGRGWVRVVSGFQSLFSVYLLAIWALTYFGRPFQ